MSYCRFSSDDFQCDVYCYAHCDGGFVTHVAQNRHTSDEPRPVVPDLMDGDVQAYVDAHAKLMAWLDRATLVEIDLPHAGQDFHDDNAGQAAERLEELQAIGFRVPQYAIDALHEEARGQR